MGRKEFEDGLKEEGMECPHCHNIIGTVAVIKKVVYLADLVNGNTVSEYYRDDDPIEGTEDIRCPECDGSLMDYVEE